MGPPPTFTFTAGLLLVISSVSSFHCVSNVAPNSMMKPRPQRLTRFVLEASATEKAEILREKAERARLEATQLDAQLTERKIATIEDRLRNPKVDENEKQNMKQQLQMLKVKASGANLQAKEEVVILPDITDVPPTPERPSVAQVDGAIGMELASERPLSGFDESDLALYIPAIEKLENAYPNATTNELLKQFRLLPELQDHFREKINEILELPLENLQKLEELKMNYLSTSSSVEKSQIKREMEKLQNELDANGPEEHTGSIFLDVVAMSDEELQLRLKTMQSLPAALQVIFKLKNEVDKDGDLTLAILKDHYDSQLQLLLQVKYAAPLDETKEADTRKAIALLPSIIRGDLIQQIGLSHGANDEELLQAIFKESEGLGIDTNPMAGEDGSLGIIDFDDIDVVDRSRYVVELYPSIAKLESNRPTLTEIQGFIDQVLDKKDFMQASPPELVVGCYYIKGQNLQPDDEGGRKLVKSMRERLEKSTLSETLDFFYVLDPSPLSVEEIEMGNESEPLVIVTRKDHEVLYESISPVTKLTISTLGIISIVLFSFAVCDIQPGIQERLDQSLAVGITDSDWITDIAWSSAFSLFCIHLVHEVAHFSVSQRDQFKIGLPSFVASIQLGLQGCITPIKSPPPSLRSLFDFAMAGPLCGIIASLGVLVHGLMLTSATPVADISALPALPTSLLRTSSLGGELVEYFLGSGTGLVGGLLQTSEFIPLHPEAIAGYVGLIANSLALLPLGNTDGGRISLAVFGRRGAFLVKLLASVVLCLAGIFGYDPANVLLFYLVFCLLCQSKLENPVQNEVEELDFGRGALAIVVACFVTLSLYPV